MCIHVVILAALPASAQLIVYDDFQEKVLDPNKWFGRGSQIRVWPRLNMAG